MRSSNADKVYPRLGAVLGVRDTKADIALGRDIAARGADDEIAGLVELLDDQEVASSAIKAIYECGYLAPELLVPHLERFRALMDCGNNRLVWGGTVAVWCVATAAPERVWPHRERLERCLRIGTVITQMSAVQALTTVASSDPAKADELEEWFEEVLETIGPRQLIKCGELIVPVARPEYREHLLGILVGRGDELPSAAARKRLQKLVRKCGS